MPNHGQQQVLSTLQVDLRTGEEDTLVRSYATSLSLDGLFVRVGRPLEVGTELDLDLVVPDDGTAVPARARVVAIHHGPGYVGMELEFVSEPSDRLRQLASRFRRAVFGDRVT